MNKEEALKSMSFCAVAVRGIPKNIRTELITEGLAELTDHGPNHPMGDGYERHVIDLTNKGLVALSQN